MASRVLDGAVLLGGRSRRMGRDKAHLEVGGVALATRVARLLAEACETVWLVGAAPPPQTPGTAVPDPDGPACALRGLVAAFEASQAEHLLVLATDLPLVTRGFLSALTSGPPADAWVPRDAEGSHPLCARYRRASVLPVVRERLAGEDLSLHGLLAQLETRWLEGDALQQVDPSGSALLNVNEPADLARAEEVLAARER